MKTTELESPSAESSNQCNPCCDTTQRFSYALGLTADDGHDYYFGAAQFLEAELEVNLAVEKSEKEAPERLSLRFATGEAVILGRGLRRVAQWLQRGELENIRPLDRRYISLRQSGPMVLSVVVTRKSVVV